MEHGSAIRFWCHGGTIDVRDLPATTTVLEWLRLSAGARGTKEGCDEGDCGACTVAIADLDSTGGPDRLTWRSVNACLTLLPMLDGRALLTIEDVAATSPDGLHPIQRSIVEGHATQCGFCTPGIVMALWCMDQRSRATGRVPTRADITTELAGNLCRCTGYRSILDAAEKAFASPPAPYDSMPVVAALKGLQAGRTFRDEGGDGSTFRYEGGDGSTFLAPSTIAELDQVVTADPDALVIAGGTDLALAVTRPGTRARTLVWTGRVAEMTRISQTATHLRIGAAVPLEDGWSALCAHIPSLTQTWIRFAAPAVRHMGTMGGNLVTASPIGDTAPVLLALDATLELLQSGRRRSLPVSDLFVGYRETCLRPGEILLSIDIPLPSLQRDVRSFKLSKRFDSDISSVSAAMWVALTDGEVVEDARIAFGGMGPSVSRATHVEESLLGHAWTRTTMESAQQALLADVSPISDHRGSAEYRLEAAGGLLERFWLQTRPDQQEALTETDIWSLP